MKPLHGVAVILGFLVAYGLGLRNGREVVVALRPEPRPQTALCGDAGVRVVCGDASLPAEIADNCPELLVRYQDLSRAEASRAATARDLLRDLGDCQALAAVPPDMLPAPRLRRPR